MVADYIVEAKSRKALRGLANVLRDKLGLTGTLYMPIVELLDILPEIFKDFSYEIVDDAELPFNTHADTDVHTGHIRIKESVYERACNGEGRDRMTIAHEIGHFFTLCFCGFKLHRNFRKQKVKNYEDPEWQAKCFAGKFMIPKCLVEEMNPSQISEVCGVSLDAAEYQYKHW